jgi:acyl carrier protein
MSPVNRDEITEKIMAFVCRELVRDREEVTLESDLAGMGADSLNLTEIVLEMEEAFGFEMSEEEMKQIQTVGDLVGYAESRIG